MKLYVNYKEIVLPLEIFLFLGNKQNKKRKFGTRTHHLLGERIDAGELALSDDDSLEVIDLIVEELPLRVDELGEGVDGGPNL